MVDFAWNFPDIASLAWPNRLSRAAWRELRNKLEAFRAFALASRWINDTGDAGEDLVRSALAATRQNDFHGLWTTEGLGYHFTRRALQRDGSVRDLMSQYAARLPARSLLPLHTGMGLALASDALHCLSPGNSARQIRDCLQHYFNRCADNAVDGYAGAAQEALGLVARLLRPAMLNEIDQRLGEVDPSLSATFWHGVGRGLYFTPVDILPCSSAAWPSLNSALNEPPHAPGRENALAGLAWAVALVNIRSPEVLELFLTRHGRRLPISDSFANGVASAASVWQAWAPRSHHLSRHCGHQPHGTDLSTATIWERNARPQCRPGFAANVVQRMRENRMEDLFRVDVGPANET